MCTIQVCTSAFGYTDSITSGNPFSPSTQAMKMSFTPRFCNSVSTCSQNFAPSFCAAQSPRTSLLPCRFTAIATWIAWFRMCPPSRTFTRSASMYRIGYTSSKGRFCHVFTSSITASVTLETKVGETSTP